MRKLIFLLTCALLGWTSSVSAPGDNVYENSLDEETGLTKVGGVTIEASGESAFGNVYKNPGGSARSSYLVLPSEVLHKSATSNQLTIAFWVKAVTENASDTYMWAPIFTAFESSDKLGQDNWTHLGIEYRGILEYNLNGPGNSGANWCDFTNAQQTGNGGGNNFLYHNTNDWLKDKGWHHMAIVFDASNDSQHKVTVYMDGAVANEWTFDGTSNGQNIRNFFSNASKLDYVCFGGCQIRGFGDNDAPFWYDDLYITNGALTQAQVKNIVATKRAAILGTAENTDYTSLIFNHKVEYGTIAGYSISGASVRTNGFEIWHKSPAYVKQELTGLPNGKYTITCQATHGEGESANSVLYAKSGAIETTAAATKPAENSGGGAFEAETNRMLADENLGKISVNIVVNDGNLEFGFKQLTNAQWDVFTNFTLTYVDDGLSESKILLAAAVTKAKALVDGNTIPNAAETALQAVINDNDNDDDAFTTNSQFETAIGIINTAYDTYKVLEDPYAGFALVKTGADAIAAVEYTETTSGSHSTFDDAITTQVANVEAATAAATITTAIKNLKDAIKTYIAGVEPKNDGEYFDITCLMTNPNFDDSHNGWTYLSAPGVSYSNCEYYETEFDINQTITGLPTGSYSLNVQAFQRPGGAIAVYNDYIAGTDNATSVLYINSITSKVKNIAADAQVTGKLGDDTNWNSWPNDSRVGEEGSYKYLPNSQQGSNLYFSAGLYDATCAAVVTKDDGGSLKLGFKSTQNHVTYDWTIFDNFRLRYYGSSLLVYYKQYLPQLKTEATADLSNGTYANILNGSEHAAFVAALAATPAAETEAAYKAVIDDILAAQTAFRNAKDSYDAFATAKTTDILAKYTANIGTNPFQYNETTNNSLYSACQTAKTNVDNYTTSSESTAAAVQALVDALNTAISNYQNQALNAPDAEKHYKIIVATADHAKLNNAVTVSLGSTSTNNPTGYSFNASAAPATYLAQACKFTQVSGNTYNISFETAEGTVYLTYGSLNGSAADWKKAQIQGNTNAEKKGTFRIAATTTDNVFNIYNTEASATIACQTGGALYTESGNADFSLTEASQATVNVTIASDVVYGTRIFPFAPTLPSGVKAYSCAAEENDVLTLEEVATPAANVPYILEAESGCESTNLEGYGLAKTANYTTGWLVGVYAETAAPVGSYVLQKNNSKVGFYKVVTDKQPTVGANRCYLTVPAQGRAAYFFGEDNTPTSINAIEALTNGDATIYDMNGRQINKLQKGMNIVKANGKSYKLIVK